MSVEYSRKNNTVYRRLKADILGMKYKPGEKISEELIAFKYGTSRSPARDALKRLQHEGLILVEPQVGSFIAEISVEQLKGVLQARMALEPVAVEWATPRTAKTALAPIRADLERLRQINPGERKAEQQETDRRLHYLLLDNCGNEYVATFLKQMIQRMSMMELYTTFPDIRRMEDALKETLSILEAVETGDSKAASGAMLHHLFHICEAFEKSVNSIRNNS
jgi:DNA-binding GntR family transcriptional regulator